MTLAEFEQRCINGPIGSVLPVDELAALNRVQELATRYRERLEEHAAHWKPVKTPRRRRHCGIEQSIPKGDRE